jgi:hypothetical protein
MKPGDVVCVTYAEFAQVLFGFKHSDALQSVIGRVQHDQPLLIIEIDDWACKVMLPDGMIGWLKKTYLIPVTRTP